MTTPPRPPGTVAWIDLTTSEVTATADFYAGLLGWELHTEDTPMGPYVVGMIPAGPAAGLMAPMPGTPESPPSWTVYISVADIDATWATALEAGATPLMEPMEIPGGDRVAMLVDPASAVIGMMQPTEEGSMAFGGSGAVVWVETDTRDTATSQAFYERVFGWSTVESPGYALFTQDGDQVAGLMDIPPGVPDEVAAYWLVYFGVEDVVATVARATELGGTVAAPPMTVGGMRFAVLEDPVGAAFAVLQQSDDGAAVSA